MKQKTIYDKWKMDSVIIIKKEEQEEEKNGTRNRSDNRQPRR